MDAIRQRGLDDLVLLDSISEENVLTTLQNRLVKENQMYTFMGPVLVALNPYKVLTDKSTGGSIYSEAMMDSYRGRVYYEVSPSVFAIAEGAYSYLLRNRRPAAVIVSGESGAGKTETARQILAYIARATTNTTKPAKKGPAGAPPAAAGAGVASAAAPGAQTFQVKDKLVTSTLVTEAFGNAMTVRNDNSSRFGKLMTVSFKPSGQATSGYVEIYLLEKHRVISQSDGERSFHAFYYLLAGATPTQKASLKLGRAEDYRILNNESRKIPGVNDATQFKAVCACMKVLGISEADQTEMWKILSAVLHLGNVEFRERGEGEESGAARGVLNAQAACVITDGASGAAFSAACQLLSVSEESMTKVLTERSIVVGSSVTMALQTKAQADATRDSFAKALYEKLFGFAVAQVNTSIEGTPAKSTVVVASPDGTPGTPPAPDLAKAEEAKQLRLSILDLYGFEIFDKNGFEQLCINFVNESLQQLFIEATLRAEQVEYEAEGIAWTPIDYFDNQIVVDLFVKKPGVYSLMDDACQLAEGDKDSLLRGFDSKLAKHPHYVPSKVRDGTFIVKHYAGDVQYTASSMVEANRDTLHNDLISLMGESSSKALKSMFADSRSESEKLKRPPTAGSQFRKSVDSLIEVLAESEPYYIRCIKSNDLKKPTFVDAERVAHQIRYLGLVEATRVKRAGYAYRATYEEFLNRYRMITSLTWPPRNDNAEEQVTNLLKTINVWSKPANELLAVGASGNKAGAGAGAGKPGAGASNLKAGAGAGVGKATMKAAVPAASGPKIDATKLPGDVAIAGSVKLELGKDYQLGTSKVFLKEPRTLFAFEYMRMVALGRVTSKIAAVWRGFAGKRAYARIKLAWKKQAARVKGHLARKAFLRMKKSAVSIQRIARGHLTRSSRIAMEMRQALGMIKLYGKTRRRMSLQWDVPASSDWLGMVDGRTHLPGIEAARVERALNRLTPRQTLATLHYADYVWKVKQNYTVLRRALVVTDNYLLNFADPWAKGKINRRIPITSIASVSVSPFRDNYIVVHVTGEYDFVCLCETKMSLLRALADRFKALSGSALPVRTSDSLTYRAYKGDSEMKLRRITFSQVADEALFASRKPAVWEEKLTAAAGGAGGPTLRREETAASTAVTSTVVKAHLDAEKHKAFHEVQTATRTMSVFVPEPKRIKVSDMLTEAEKTRLTRMGCRFS